MAVYQKTTRQLLSGEPTSSASVDAARKTFPQALGRHAGGESQYRRRHGCRPEHRRSSLWPAIGFDKRSGVRGHCVWRDVF
jgi:hypothetical protein